MVKAFHRAGLEVILDVVFNHTAEGGTDGPTFCFRGFENEVYYLLDRDRSRYADYTGTGNTLNANHPVVRRADPGQPAPLGRAACTWTGSGSTSPRSCRAMSRASLMPHPPVLWDIESDPGSPARSSSPRRGTRRDSTRSGASSATPGRSGTAASGTTSAASSRATPAPWRAWPPGSWEAPTSTGTRNGNRSRASTSSPATTASPWRTWSRTTSKHNEANGEENRDGADDNASWNCGVEGTDRGSGRRGAPQPPGRRTSSPCSCSRWEPRCSSMGDEVRRTQRGNNNAYCQDNRDQLVRLDAARAAPAAPPLREVADRLSRATGRGGGSAAAHAEPAPAPLPDRLARRRARTAPTGAHDSRSLALCYHQPREPLPAARHAQRLLGAAALRAAAAPQGARASWRRWIDTALPTPEDIAAWEDARRRSSTSATWCSRDRWHVSCYRSRRDATAMVTPRPARGDEVVLVRHGETEWSLSGQHTGTTDIPLTEHGREQAKLLRAAALRVGLRSGALEPARSAPGATCELAGLGDRMQVDPDLRRVELRRLRGPHAGGDRAHRARAGRSSRDGCPGGESPDQVGARVDRLIGKVRAPAGRVALFAHGHVFRVFAARWIGFPPTHGRHFMLDTSTLSVLSYYRGIPRVKRWNAPVEPQEVIPCMTHSILEAPLARWRPAGKGILAADETSGTLTKRFAALKIPSTPRPGGTTGSCCSRRPGGGVHRAA